MRSCPQPLSATERKAVQFSLAYPFTARSGTLPPWRWRVTPRQSDLGSPRRLAHSESDYSPYTLSIWFWSYYSNHYTEDDVDACVNYFNSYDLDTPLVDAVLLARSKVGVESARQYDPQW